MHVYSGIQQAAAFAQNLCMRLGRVAQCMPHQAHEPALPSLTDVLQPSPVDVSAVCDRCAAAKRQKTAACGDRCHTIRSGVAQGCRPLSCSSCTAQGGGPLYRSSCWAAGAKAAARHLAHHLRAPGADRLAALARCCCTRRRGRRLPLHVSSRLRRLRLGCAGCCQAVTHGSGPLAGAGRGDAALVRHSPGAVPGASACLAHSTHWVVTRGNL